MAKIILGITGEMGGGKGTVAKHIEQEHNGGVHRFSAILRDILDRIYLEQSRDNLQKLSTLLRKNFGEDLLSKSVYKDAQKDEHEIVVVDGVRRMDDMELLRKLPNFKLIYVDSDIKVRYERIIKRGENSDDAKKSFEEFKKINEDESESQIQDLRNYSDYVIDNNGTFIELYQQVENILKENLQ
jgi:dephospho-CoA kinase